MSSPAMEQEGLLRGLNTLANEGVFPHALITDQHQGITKLMREQFQQVDHFYDGWHVVKGIRKKLMAITKEKGNEDEFTLDRVNAICNR